jgi:transcriptional regulator with XRE-family HTH domain
VHLGGRGVARRTAVHHKDLAAGPGQHQGRGQAGGNPPNNYDVVFTHAPKAAAERPSHLRTLLFLGNESQMSLVADPSTAKIATVLDQVGARLKRLRTQRGMTLTGVARSTGISKSTMSRLETGQRRPTLELLLALSHAYRVPLDDLVAAPEVGDPRLKLKPGRVKGRTVIPLTRQPDGMQAWKIVIPTSNTTPEPRAHDGHEWIYVLSGNMRFVLGDQDWVLGPGEVAEFDTKVPHWFGSTGDEPAEILSIFGRPGERMTVRTTHP